MGKLTQLKLWLISNYIVIDKIFLFNEILVMEPRDWKSIARERPLKFFHSKF